MSLNFTVQPGKIFATGEKVTNAKLNALGVPVIQAQGTIAPSDMATADYAAKLLPGAYVFATATLSGANYVVAFNPALTTYTEGLWLAFKTANANPANPGLDAGAGAKPLYQYGGRARVEAGDILAGTIVEVRYNSTLVSGGCWEVQSLTGPFPTRAAFQPASAYTGGEQGLVPRPAVGQHNHYLRGDGQWVDVVSAAVSAAVSNAQQEIFKQQNFV